MTNKLAQTIALYSSIGRGHLDFMAATTPKGGASYPKPSRGGFKQNRRRALQASAYRRERAKQKKRRGA